MGREKRKRRRKRRACGGHDPLGSGIVRDVAKYHLRFSTELAGVVRVNVQM